MLLILEFLLRCRDILRNHRRFNLRTPVRKGDEKSIPLRVS